MSTKNFFQNALITGIVGLIFGILFVMFPIPMQNIVLIVGALFLIVMGVKLIFDGKAFSGRYPTEIGPTSLGIVLIVAGIVVLILKSYILLVLPVLFGIVLLVGGITKAVEAFSLRKLGDPAFWVSLIISALTIVLGFLMIAHPAASLEVWLRIFGISLIINSIGSFFGGFRGRRYSSDRVVDGSGEEVG